jgi:L-aspartate oxidase
VIAARLVVEAALARRESRGGHFRTDFPDTAARPEHTTATLPADRAGRRAAA